MRETPFHTATVQHGEHTIRVDWFYDNDCEAPWEHECGHGPVRHLRRPEEKRPGERPLGDGWYYDIQEATVLALRDGWDAPPYKTGTRRQQAARAVEADYKHLRGFIRGDWHWAGYVVSVDDEEGDSLWGIDSPSMQQFEDEAVADTKEQIDKEETAALDYACRC